MILQSLYRYYQILLDDPDAGIAAPGYSAANVSFALNLSPRGKLLDVPPFTSKFFDGKKERERNYRRMAVPEQVKRAGINPKPNFLCDNCTFVLGISDKDQNDNEYSSKRFEAFREHNIKLLSEADSVAARAVIAFLKKHDPQTARECPVIARNLDALLEGGNLIFWVDGKSILQDPAIRRVWEEHYSGEKAVTLQCLVTGEIEPIARLHPSIQGVQYAQTSGASLVSFDDAAFQSYGHKDKDTKGLNSPVSRRAAAGYGEALKYLLSNQNPNRKIHLGDTTVVYWAESENKAYANAFASLINPAYMEPEPADKQRGRKNAEAKLAEIAPKVQGGKPLDIDALRAGLDESTRFYVLGLAPNAARLAVRFFLNEPFGKLVERIMLHYDDLRIQKGSPYQPDYVSPFRLLAECVSPKVTRRDEELKTSWALMGGALMQSILTGASYPEGLYAAILNRIRHDSDEEGKSRKITYVRAAFIKAHLLRKYRRQPQNPYQEALQMSLNETYTHPAYVLGRLFAVLEDLQIQSAKPVKLDTTIKDRYFTSACATPASVFPVLLRLSQHHIAKSKYGYASDNRIKGLLDLLDAKPFPAHLTLDEQGIFVLGYYHQRAAFYIKNSDNTAESIATEN